MRTILIAGCGFVGRIALALFKQARWEVTVITRTQDSANRLQAEFGCRALSCDISNRGEVAALDLPGFDAVVDCVSAGASDTEEYRRVYYQGAVNLLEAQPVARFLFTSSSSVYGQDDGSLVTEESPATPEGGPGLVLRSTEELVLARGGIVTRLTGIYGPGRAMLLRRFLEGSAVIEGDGSRHLNQIHCADAASAVFFLLSRPGIAGVFNVTDNASPTQREFYGWLADYYDKPLPPEGPANPQRRRFATDKRVSNARLRALGWEPVYPSFLHALKQNPGLLERLMN